nr:unnamed protein product [Callosobruchus chinensis]
MEWPAKRLGMLCNFGEQLEIKLTGIFITNYNPGKVRTELFGGSDSTNINNAVEEAEIIEATVAINHNIYSCKLLILSLYWYDISPAGVMKYPAKLSLMFRPRLVDLCCGLRKGAEAKKKWTHIRDYFRRDFQKNKSAPTGSAAKKVKKYVYADLLYFLIPVFDKRNTEGNYQSDYLHDNISQEYETQEEHSVEQVDSNILQPPSPISTPPANSLKRKKKDIPSQILSILHQNQQKANQKRQEVEDDDMKFLLSFRTHMKHMNENQKIDFKLGMLQLEKITFRRLNLHKCKAEAMQQLLKSETARSETDKKTCVMPFDLQQALPIPKLTTGPAFYCRKILMYNLGIHDCTENAGHMCVWTENIAKRGSDEVASIFIKFMSSK